MANIVQSNVIDSTTTKWIQWKGTVYIFKSLVLINFTFQKPSNREVSANVLNALRSRYNGRSSIQQTEIETAQQSMELMRLNVQQSFDREVQAIVKKYIEVSGIFIRNWKLYTSILNPFTDFFRASIETCQGKC